MPTAPTPIAAAPDAPDKNDRATFNLKAYNWAVYQKDSLQPQANALGLNVYSNALEAEGFALAATAQAAIATAATAVVGAVAFNAATVYAAGQAAYSLVNLQTYRRNTAGSSATDPANDAVNWTKVSFRGGLGDVAQALPITMTASSANILTVTSTAPGRPLTLPAATTCPEGDFARAFNSSRYDVPVRNDAGTLLGFIAPKSSVNIALADNTTAAGVWIVDGASYFGITAAGLVSPVGALPAAGANMQVVNLDADRDLILWADGTRLSACVYTYSTYTFGAVVAVRVANVGTLWTAIKSAANQALVVSHAAGSTQHVVLSIALGVITVNAAVAVGTTITDMGDLIAVNAGFVYQYGDTVGPGTNMKAVTIAGTVPTVGAAVALAASGGALAKMFVSGVTLVTFAGSGANLTARSYTLAGVVLTVGVQATIAFAPATFVARELASGRWAIAAGLVGIIANLAGATMTLTSVALAAIVTTTWAHVCGSQMIIADASGNATVLTDNAGVAVAGSLLTFTPVAPTNMAYLGGTATEMWLVGYTALSSSAQPIRAYAIGIAGNNAVVNASSIEHIHGSELITLTTPSHVNALGREFGNTMQGTWGISLGQAASNTSSYTLAFDGTTLKMAQLPSAPLGVTAAGLTLYGYSGNVSAPYNNKSVRWAIQQELNGTTSSLRIMKVEAA